MLRGLRVTAFVPLVALIFLLGAGAAQATPTVILDGDSVTRIEKLEVPDLFGEVTVYNVDFEFTNAVELYDCGLLFCDFDLRHENAALGLIAVLAALNANDPLPMRAGPEDTLSFFIGSFSSLVVIAAVGGEFYPLGQDVLGSNIPPETWDTCRFPSCIASVNVLAPTQNVTYARFTVIPEPGTALLLGLGIAGFGAAGRSRR